MCLLEAWYVYKIATQEKEKPSQTLPNPHPLSKNIIGRGHREEGRVEGGGLVRKAGRVEGGGARGVRVERGSGGGVEGEDLIGDREVGRVEGGPGGGKV